MIINSKEIKSAVAVGGEIGPSLDHVNAGGQIAYSFGPDLNINSFGQPINLVTEYQNHIGFLIQFSTFKQQWLFISKKDVLEWGVLEYNEIPKVQFKDHSGAIAGLLLYGPIGAIIGSAMDQNAANKQNKKPVIGIMYHQNDSENAMFIDFPINKWYYNLHEFLLNCLPEKHKE